MSIHPSMKISEKDRKQRSVLKRIERLKIMAEKNQWTEKNDVYGLPKIKTLRIKIKKEKAAEKVGAPTTGEALPTVGLTKEQPAAKAPTSKGQDKKNK